MAMTRQRSVTPEAFSREEMLELAPEVRLTEIGLRLYADDLGRERVNARLIKAQLYPLTEDIRERDIDGHLLELDDVGAIDLYVVDSTTFFQFTDWPKVDHAKRSKYPAPPDEPSRESREDFASHSWRGREGESESGSERERAGESPDRTSREGDPPSPFCPRHQDTGGSPHPCVPCGRARLQRKVWDDKFHSDARVTFEADE